MNHCLSTEKSLPIARESEDTTMMWGYGYDPGWGSWLMMVFGNILWIALVGILVWGVIRWFERRPDTSTPQKPDTSTSGPSALEILSQRYARGEIDAATFEQMRERILATSTYRPSGNQQQITTGVH